MTASEGTQWISLKIDDMTIRLNCIVSKVLDDCDLYATFKSRDVEKLLNDWGVRAHFRRAYRSSENGVVERNHLVFPGF